MLGDGRMTCMDVTVLDGVPQIHRWLETCTHPHGLTSKHPFTEWRCVVCGHTEPREPADA